MTCEADRYALWCDKCSCHPVDCPEKARSNVYIRQEKIAPPGVFTTPPDVKQCLNYNENGATPCWHPHCDCFLWHKAAQEHNTRMRWLKWTVGFPLAVLLVIAVCLTLMPKAHGGEWKTIPYFCHAMYGMPRNCDSVKSYTRRWGRTLAIRLARACGASEADLAEAQACIDGRLPVIGPSEGAR